MDPDLEEVPCVLCGGPGGEPLAERGQHGLPAHVRICPNDGLVFLSPRWTRSRYARFYREEYDRRYRPAELAAQADPEYEAEQVAKGRAVRDRLGAHAADGARSVLEIGSGSGRVLAAVAAGIAGAELCAIEPSPRARERLGSELGVEVIGDDVDADWHEAHAGRFDVVVMRHVLEHLLDPVAALGRVRAALSGRGVVYVAVPDMMHPVGDLERHWFRCVHAYYFSLETLTWVAARAGLAPVATGAAPGEVWSVLGAAEPTEARGSVFDRQVAAIRDHRAARGGPVRALRRLVARLSRRSAPV